jgi:hypothetical protein
MCAIPSTIWYRISRPWTRRNRSFVDILRRRAASEALRSSVDIGTSLIKPKFTTEDLDLVLDLGQHGEVVGIEKNVPAVFQRSEQGQGLLEVKTDTLWGLLGRWWHA